MVGQGTRESSRLDSSIFRYFSDSFVRVLM